MNAAPHNPTGGSLSPAIAHRLLQLAEAHDFRIVEDDMFAEFRRHPTPILAAMDGLKRVIHLGSFSKTSQPACAAVSSPRTRRPSTPCSISRSPPVSAATRRPRRWCIG